MLHQVKLCSNDFSISAVQERLRHREASREQSPLYPILPVHLQIKSQRPNILYYGPNHGSEISVSYLCCCADQFEIGPFSLSLVHMSDLSWIYNIL